MLINLIIFIAFNCPHHNGRHRRYVGTPSSRQLVILIGNLQNIQIFYIGEAKPLVLIGQTNPAVWAVVVAQLAEGSHLTPEVYGSNPDIGEI